MKPNKVREMTDVELENELSNLKAQLFRLRFQSATNQLDNPLQIKSVRKDIARILTVLKEREILAAKEGE